MSVFTVLFIFTKPFLGTKEQCRGNILQLPIRKAVLGRTKSLLGMTLQRACGLTL